MKRIIDFIKNIFMRKKVNKNSGIVVEKEFHPEIMFFANRPYSEYVDFEEIKNI